MKSLIKCSLVLAAAALLASSVAYSQDRGNGRPRPSPNAAISQNIGTTVVSITYGRPGLKGRAVESLVPDGKVWRTGANESTAITFSGDVKVGGEPIAAGTYSLYSLTDGDDFYFIINSKLSWGTRYDAAMARPIRPATVHAGRDAPAEPNSGDGPAVSVCPLQRSGKRVS